MIDMRANHDHFLCVVYGDVTEITKPGRTKVVVYLPVSGPPQRPSLVL